MSFEIFNVGYCHICRVIGKKMHTSPHKVSFRCILLIEILFSFLCQVFYPINPVMLLCCIDGVLFNS